MYKIVKKNKEGKVKDMKTFAKVQSSGTYPNGFTKLRTTYIDIEEIIAIREEKFANGQDYYDVFVGDAFFSVSVEDGRKLLEKLKIEE